MSIEDFRNNYELIFGEPKTINSGTSKVLFNQRKVSIRDKIRGTLTPTEIYVGEGSEELAFGLVWDNYIDKTE